MPAVRSIRTETGTAAPRQGRAGPTYQVIPQYLHDPHVWQIDFRVSKITRAARRPSDRRRAGLLLTPNCQGPPALCRHTELRQNRPTLASVSKRWSLLDGMSVIVVGSFYGTNPINTSHHGLSPRYPMRLLFRLQRPESLCRRFGRDLSVGILAPPPCPAAGPEWSHHPGPDPSRPPCRGGPRAEIRHVHQPPAVQGHGRFRGLPSC